MTPPAACADLSIQRAALGGSPFAGVENSQSALNALLIDHAALTQPFKFPGLALNVRLEIDVAVQERHPRLPPPHDLGEDFVMIFVLQNPDGMPIAPGAGGFISI